LFNSSSSWGEDRTREAARLRELCVGKSAILSGVAIVAAVHRLREDEGEGVEIGVEVEVEVEVGDVIGFVGMTGVAGEERVSSRTGLALAAVLRCLVQSGLVSSAARLGERVTVLLK